ncbi:MAG TPA: ATP-binding protein [Sphingobium sp.]|uniref:ATP-binding protein n=1 Tax=Sphingobium sp. TaxID=1912891 RepID=UPI002ED585EC
MSDTATLLTRIAEALERIAPPPLPPADLGSHAAYRWNGTAIEVIHDFAAPDYELLTGIDAQKAACLDNTRRLSQGLPAHDVLLWGARGTGKSATVAACIGKVREDGGTIGLVDFASSDLHSLPVLLGQLRAAERPFILFLDDLGFDENFVGDARALRSILQGGATARGGLVRLYATSNRRHIVARNLSENDPVNPRDVADDKLALADRFGLSLGFHALDQDTYVEIVKAYADRFGLPFAPDQAVQWSTQRGSRSGRVAWQYIVELAGRVGKSLTQ